MGKHISRFNPQRMSEEDVLNLATGRDNLLKLMIGDMQNCMHTNSNQHFILYGPRGIGKSFFTRLLKITHDRSNDFKKSIFIQLPEEQSNLNFVADLLDMISTKLEGKLFNSLTNRWDIDDNEWNKSKKRLTTAIEQLKKKEGIEHVFFTMENLQDFIPKLSPIENGRMREILSDFSNLTLIGSSLHPDLDNNYNKKLFQVFKKIDLKPWGEKDYITYYRKKASINSLQLFDEEKTKLSENRIRAIANFTGGSPRLAVILNSLILNDDIISTFEIMNGIIDELTPYYQDLTKDIPPRSKLLFDLLIRMGENITQSQLAGGLQPPQEQKTIARSFSWLTDNYYVNAIKQKIGNVKHYYVRDRLYVLYYQNREVMADQKYSFVETFIEFLTEFYNQQELKDHLQKIDNDHFLSKELLFAYTKKIGIELEDECTLKQLKEAIASQTDEIDMSFVIQLANEKNYKKAIEELKRIKDFMNKSEYFSSLGYLYSLDKNHNESIENFIKAIKLESKNSEYFYAIGTEYEILEDNDLAIKNYEICLELDPSNTDLYNNLGRLHATKTSFKESKKYYLKSLANNPNDINVILELGALNYNLKDYTNSIKYFNEAIKIDSSRWDIYRNLGVVLNFNRNHKLAIEILEKGIKLYSNESSMFTFLANSYFKLGNNEKAEENLLNAIKLEPKLESNIISLYAFYLSIFDYKKLNKFILNNSNTQNEGVRIANVLSELLKDNRSENFHQIMKVITWLKKDNESWLLPFISSLTSELYARKQYNLIGDVVEELKSIPNTSLQILIQAWQYILNPEKGDLAALHPDARIAVQAVLEIKN